MSKDPEEKPAGDPGEGLARVTPGSDEHALVAPNGPAPRLRVADSLATARAGELFFVDKRGRVLGQRRRRLVQGTSWAIMGGTVVANGLFYRAMWSPLAGLVATLVTGGYLFFKLRKWPAYRAAMALAADSRWEEAHARLVALGGGGLPRLLRSQVPVMVGALDQILGRHQAALDRIDPALAQLGDSSSVVRWQATSVRVQALAQLGRLADARRELERFVLPRTDYVELLYQSAALSLAFAADAPESLPADDVLHEWARAALLRSRFGETLVGLAWVFQRRGDEDMARHLLEESTSRIPRPSLPTAQPGLDAWATKQRVAWAIDPEAT